MSNPDSDDPTTQARAMRLLIATLDGDEARADRVLDEQPDLTPRQRAIYKSNAIDLAERMEADDGRDAALAALESALLELDDEQEAMRDPIGHTWTAMTFNEPDAST